MRVRRLLCTLLVAVLLGPTFGPVLQRIQEACVEEQQSCCAPDGVCDHTCVDCACCAASAISLSSPSLAGDLSSPPVQGIALRTATPPAAPSSDILKVPKSA